MSRTTEVARLSGQASSRPSWSLAVFAHNEAGRIGAALRSIGAAAGGHEVDVVVLANGCTDRTVAQVRAGAPLVPHLSLAEIDMADKANAWNAYVHDVSEASTPGGTDVHFFMDGDVTLEPDALPLLAAALDAVPDARAAGGVPATGRDRDAWRRRMMQNGSLAGNLYALRGSFVDELRQRGIRMPAGLIGEDLFLSWLVDRDIASGAPLPGGARSVFHVGAEFSFPSLSFLRASDYRLYVRRKWRYLRRALQHEMLTHLLADRGLGAMPRDVQELYRVAPLPSRLRWVGLETPLRTLEVLRIRSIRRRDSRRTV
jgi:glycosyltransferase involved in cell wall biosynthesis